MEFTHDKGRVLRVKTGYNPNSSSVGSSLPQFFVFAAAAGALTMAGMQIAFYFKSRKRKDRGAPGAENP